MKTFTKKTKIFVALLLCMGMATGMFTGIAPLTVDAATVNAKDSGYYNVAYETTDGSTTFGNGTAIFVTNETRKNLDKNKSEAVYTFNGTVWSSKTKDSYVVWEGKGENTFHAVYPYNAGYTSFTLPSDQSSVDKLASSDWMTATCTTDKSKDEIVFDFGHLLTKVTVNITGWNDEYTGEETVTNVKFYSRGNAFHAAYGTENQVTVTTSESSLKEVKPLEDTATKSYTAIIAPAAYTDGETFMKLKVDNDELTVLANETLKDGLQSGCHYTFEITVGKDKVALTQVRVNNWIQDSTISDVIAEEFPFVYSNDNTVATATISKTVTEKHIQNGLKYLDIESLKVLIIDGNLGEELQKAIAERLNGKNVTVYLPRMSSLEVVTELKNSSQCGYAPTINSEGNVIGYIVYSAEGLISWNTAVQSNLSLNLTLAENIILNSSGDSNWTSVGNESSPYRGTVDGAGYSISNLKINQQAKDAGFIGYSKGSTVKNLTLKNVSVNNTQENTGGLVGYMENGTIEFCRIESGTVYGTFYVGGFVGKIMYDGKIIASSNAASVDGSSWYFGGIVGDAERTGGIIIGCYNIGNINKAKKSWDSGGICGYSTYTQIKGCYNTASNSNYAIVGANGSAYLSNNYWSSSHDAACGTNQQYETYNTGCTKIQNTADEWGKAATEMNEVLKGYGYHYVVNSDSATSATEPLILEKIAK